MGVTVKKNKNKGNAWYVYINDKGQRSAKAFGMNKDAAHAFAKEILASIKLGQFKIRSKAESQTLAEFAEKALLGRTDIKIASIKNVQKNLRNHVLPLLGHKGLADINEDDVKELIAVSRQQELATNTIQRNILPALSSLLTAALTHKPPLIPSNPVHQMWKFAENPDEVKKEVIPLTRDEAAMLLDVLSRGRYDYWVFFLLLLRSGLRIGEAIALQWDAINALEGTIRVKRNMSDTHILSTPKKKQNRTVAMSSQLAEALRTHRLNEEAKAKRAGRKLPYEFVFNTNGQYWNQNNLRTDVFYPATEKAGLPRAVTPHWLRHTFVSQLLERNVPITTVSRLIGHNSIKITMDTYGHMIPDQNKGFVDVLDDARTQPPRNLEPEVESAKEYEVT